MNSKKSIALSTALSVMLSCSLCVHAEPDESPDTQISEQPVIQESIEQEPPEISYTEPEISQPPEPLEPLESFEPSEFSEEPPSEPSEYEDDESSYYEESYVFSEPESSFYESSLYEPSFYEPSYYYDPSQTDENPFPWAQESTDYYYQPEYSYEESYYYYEPEYSYPSVYYEESSYYYYETSEETEDSEDSEDESSVEYHETSVDSSELTSKDWENLKNSMSSDIRFNSDPNKSSDNAVRDIKDNNDVANDSINYLIWGLILIFSGIALIIFVSMSSLKPKRKMTENLQKKSKK